MRFHIHLTAFFVLLLAYTSSSGIIFSLLLNILLLKGALFMTMPLSIGAFMMGQGMGFFAGNMMGGYMMLRAANRYHHKEKVKWSSGYDSSGGYESPKYHHASYGGGGWGGWPSPNYHSAYDKGKEVGTAIYNLASHKSKLASALHSVKGLFLKNTGGWGWGPGGGYGSGGYAASTYPTKGETGDTGGYKYGPPDEGGYKYGPPAEGGYKYGPPSEGGHKYGPPLTHPGGWGEGTTVVTKGKFNPYGHLSSSSSGSQGGGYGGSYGSYGDSEGYVDTSSYGSPSSSGTNTKYGAPSSDGYYSGAYGDPGHDYTGVLSTPPKYGSPLTYAQEKSSTEDYSSDSASSSSSNSPLPNPLLEKYLEKRLQEEASKGENSVEKEEARQLIQMLRKAYLRQLVDSLKEEEMIAAANEIPTSSTERSIETGIFEEILKYRPSNKRAVKEKEKEDEGVKWIVQVYNSTANNATERDASEEAATSQEEEDNPTMWIPVENTFTEESAPFAIRVKRGSEDGASEADQKQQIATFLDDIRKFFTLLTVLDEDMCLQKLVCDVHTNQKDEGTLTEYEKNILVTFRLMKVLLPSPTTGTEVSDSSTKYRRAALIGETGQSLELCQQTYISCTYSSSQIISLGSQAEASIMSEDASSGQEKVRSMPQV